MVCKLIHQYLQGFGEPHFCKMFFRLGVLLILGVTVHSALGYYNMKRIMSPVGNVSPQEGVRTRCKSSAAFALAGWLEVAHYKMTGDILIWEVYILEFCNLYSGTHFFGTPLFGTQAFPIKKISSTLCC